MPYSRNKKSRGQPAKQTRVKLTNEQHVKIYRHHTANPQMSFQQLGQWCLEEFGLEKAPINSTLRKWLKKLETVGVLMRGKSCRIEKAIETGPSPFKYRGDSFQGLNFPEMKYHFVFLFFTRPPGHNSFYLFRREFGYVIVRLCVGNQGWRGPRSQQLTPCPASASFRG